MKRTAKPVMGELYHLPENKSNARPARSRLPIGRRLTIPSCRLLPLPDFGVCVALRIHFEFKDAADAIQSLQLLGRGAIVQDAPVADGAAGSEFAEARAFP